MHQKKSRKILLYFFLFILLGTTHNLYLKKLELPKIEQIEIIGLNEKENNEISKDLNSLYLQSLFFLNNIKIEKILSSHSIIESFSIFRKFPSTLKIDVRNINRVNLSKYSHIILPNYSGNQININRLKDFLSSGGNLIAYRGSINWLNRNKLIYTKYFFRF